MGSLLNAGMTVIDKPDRVAKKNISQIVENIIMEAKVDRSGICWDTIAASASPGNVQRKAAFGLDKGSSGIVFFLLTYYEYYPDTRLVEIIHLALVRVVAHFKRNENSVGFYSGRGGAIYTLLEAYRVLNDKIYLDMAIELGFIDYKVTGSFNLYSGVSGLLPAVIGLAEVSGDPIFLGLVRKICDNIIAGAKIKPNGLYWDELPQSMGPVNGFLYGNSGIVFGLREASKLFVNEDLFDDVIQEALAFEDSSFSGKEGNWADLLNEDHFYYDSRNRAKLTRKNVRENEFYKPGYSFSWAIGAPGTLLARKGRTDDQKYLKALERTLSLIDAGQGSANTDFSLYSGLGGMLVTAMHLGKMPNPELLDRGVNAQKKKYKELLSSFLNNRKSIDISLFHGEAGIGYSLLRSDPRYKDKPSVLFPFTTMHEGSFEKIRGERKEINDTLIRNSCGISSGAHVGEADKTENYYRTIVRLIHSRDPAKLTDIDKINFEIFNLMSLDMNFHYVTSKERNNRIGIGKALPGHVSLTRYCKLVEGSEGTILLKRSVGRVFITKLNDFGKVLLKLCEDKNKIRVTDIQHEILKMIGVGSKEEIGYVRNKVVEMTANFINEGILEPG